MRKTITALLATAALVGSTAALADRWQGNGNDHHGNSGQGWSSQGGSGQGGNGHGGNGQGGSGQGGTGQGGHWQSRSEFRMQPQNGSAGDHPHWGGRSFSNSQAGSSFVGGHDPQAGDGAQFQSGQRHWGGGNDHGQWSGGNTDHGQWNGNDGGDAKHYRRDMNGHWNDGDQRDHDQWRQADHGGHNWNHQDWNRGNWNHNEWRIFRDRNRERFHLPHYIGPRGWSYRRFYRGYTIDPFFYAQQYWIDDPWEYRLPPAYGPYRWVRYYNDALLVNVYTGEVVDVIYDFFW